MAAEGSSRSSSSVNYYAVLGVPQTASAHAIHFAYFKQIAKRQHKAGRAMTMLDQLRTAYKVLSDPASRAVYDAGLGKDDRSWMMMSLEEKEKVAADGLLMLSVFRDGTSTTKSNN